MHDIIGLADRKPPKMARQYVNLFPQLEQAVASYTQEVRSSDFPAPEHGFAIDPKPWWINSSSRGVVMKNSHCGPRSHGASCWPPA